MDLDDGYGIFEITPPKDWVGKTLAELDLRRKQNINIIGVKNKNKINVILGPTFKIRENENILVIAKISEAEKFSDK